MAIFFFDSNAIVKYYVIEPGSIWVRNLVDTNGNIGLVCEVSIAEVAAALSQIQRGKRFGRTFMQDAYRRFRSDLRNARLISHPADWKTLELAAELAMRHPLKGCDAIQVASAIIAEQTVGRKLIFISGDLQALRAATGEGLAIDDPFKHIDNK